MHTHQRIKVDTTSPKDQSKDKKYNGSKRWPLFVCTFGDRVIDEEEDEVGQKNKKEECTKVQRSIGNCIKGTAKKTISVFNVRT